MVHCTFVSIRKPHAACTFGLRPLPFTFFLRQSRSAPGPYKVYIPVRGHVDPFLYHPTHPHPCLFYARACVGSWTHFPFCARPLCLSWRARVGALQHAPCYRLFHPHTHRPLRAHAFLSAVLPLELACLRCPGTAVLAPLLLRLSTHVPCFFAQALLPELARMRQRS